MAGLIVRPFKVSVSEEEARQQYNADNFVIAPHDIRYEDLKPMGFYCPPKYGYTPESEGMWCSGKGLPTSELPNWNNCAKFKMCDGAGGPHYLAAQAACDTLNPPDWCP